jgi:D-alanyl-D-alanine carboxypeptidase
MEPRPYNNMLHTLFLGSADTLKRIASIFLALGITALLAMQTCALTTGEVTAAGAVLIDAETGQVLFDKNMNSKRHPASITKIMTGLLTVELAAPSDVATVSEDAVEFPYEVSHIALTPDEEIPVDSLMYALMLESANDAANVLAEHIDGTQADFAKRMTERALEIGAVNKNFSNPHGLDEPFHLTTAYDMALITREAIQNADFLKYFGAQRYTIPPTNKKTRDYPFVNGQHMLLPDQHLAYNESVIGGKVGFTDEAEHTMSTAARQNGRTLIAVVLGCGFNEKYYDTEALLDYGFNELTEAALPAEAMAALPTTVVMKDGQRVGEITYHADAPDSLLLPAGMSGDDIQFEYVIPETLEEGQTAEASVRFTLPDAKNGVPSLLLEQPLTASVQTDALAAGIPADAQDAPALPDSVEGKKPFSFSFEKWYLVVVPVVAAPVLLVLWRHVQIKKRRARRMKRMARVLQLRNSRTGKRG